MACCGRTKPGSAPERGRIDWFAGKGRSFYRQRFRSGPSGGVLRRADFYDFRSRYGTGGSKHVCPADLPPEVGEAVQRVAVLAHRALGCRDLSRVDFVVGDGDDPNSVTLLEVNTLPGMTPTSLYPEAAGVAGISMVDLCDGLARHAHARGPRRLHPPVPLPP